MDTVKGADLGGDDSRLVIDFNFAYNPSCAYDAALDVPAAAQAEPAVAGDHGRRARVHRVNAAAPT